MDITLLTWINTIFLIAAVVYTIRLARDISTQVSDVAGIQRAIFLQLRRQYQDIDEDLKALDRDLQNLMQAGKGA